MVLLLLLLLLWPLLALAELKTFAIVSDTHVGSPDSMYTAFIKIMEENKIEVIIHTGDAIHKPGSTAQWSEFFKITGPGKTLHLAPGNHDIRGKASLSTYLKFFPKKYYSFTDGDTIFILLNTELPGEESRITGEQFQWLKAELQRPFLFKFVFLHEPLFPLFARRHGLDRHKTARDELHRLFVKQGVQLVVAGHDHLYYRTEEQGVIYVIGAGAGGQLEYLSMNTDFFRYIVGTRTPEGYSFIARDMDGGIRDEFAVMR
jgi:3',5'-cyclic AMP phosphodiesterase CpdA